MRINFYVTQISQIAQIFSILLDLRSSLLTLDIAQTSLALFSLTRSLHPSPFTMTMIRSHRNHRKHGNIFKTTNFTNYTNNIRSHRYHR